MEIIKVENLSFAYPNRDTNALDNINISVNSGEFVTLCGKSGCGKTTFLRLLKSVLSPHGDMRGTIYFQGKELSEVPPQEQAARIGFVMQSPDNQIVTDKVWHELAFGLESLGVSTSDIRTKVAEMASFFGIDTWFHKNVSELSGGQKQILNLASVMVMQPSILVLDEPTSQLDPIAASEFLKTLQKINRELGVTVILSEHRLEEALPISDRVVVMDEGKIIADGTVQAVSKAIANHHMYKAFPAPVRIYTAVDNKENCPVTIRDGRAWLEDYTKDHAINADVIPQDAYSKNQNPIISLDNVWFRYEKDLPDVIKGLNTQIYRGELFALVGGNGTGKTTALSLLCGLNKPYRGNIKIHNEKNDSFKESIAMLPQNPQSVFVKKTVYLDLMDMLSDSGLSKAEKESKVLSMATLCHIDNLLHAHPYDLSGGEQQRAALAKVLLTSPDILLLDEPTKGLDAYFKEIFAHIINSLKAGGSTIVMVSHDIEFCAEYADRCAMFFDGSITSVGTPREFFGGNNFYTTAANRMARTTIPKALLADDVIASLGGKVENKEKPPIDFRAEKPQPVTCAPKAKKQKPTAARIVFGSIFLLMFLVTTFAQVTDWSFLNFARLQSVSDEIMQVSGLLELAFAWYFLVPAREFGAIVIKQPRSKQKLSPRSIVAMLFILLAIPLTLYVGSYFFGDRKYYFVSLLIIIETMIPFFMVFEHRKPQAREIVIVSVLCAIAVAGRSAFFMLPQFKPVVALVIIAGVCFGGETGFLVGAVTGFVSNFFLGQGPWTPWQMFSFGVIGFLAGVLFQKGVLRKSKTSLCIFGFVTTLVIYGGIMNPASVIMTPTKITKELLLTSYAVGLPLDAIHALSTAFFLWVLSEPMIDKLERVKLKYGLVNTSAE